LLLQGRDTLAGGGRPALIKGQMHRQHAQLGHISGEAAAMVILKLRVVFADRFGHPLPRVRQEGLRAAPDHRRGAPWLKHGMHRRDAQDGDGHFLHAGDGRIEDVARIVEIGKADHRRAEGRHLEQKGARRAVQHSEIDAQAGP
jgi:hypothetical protein